MKKQSGRKLSIESLEERQMLSASPLNFGLTIPSLIGVENKSAVYSAAVVIGSPQNLKLSGETANSVQLNWDAVSGATRYTVFRSSSPTSGFINVGTATTNSFKNVGLTANTTFYFQVKAANNTSTSAASATVSSNTLPGTPTGLSAVPISPVAIQLKWQAPANTGLKYEILRSASANATFTKIGEATAGFFTDTALTPETRFFYKIVAVKNTSSSLASASVSALTSKLAAPTALKASAAELDAISLTWNPAPAATNYSVFRLEKGVATKIGETSATNFKISNLLPGTAYTFQVKAQHAGMFSLPATLASATKTFSVVTNFKAANASLGTVTLNWTKQPNASAYTITYRESTAKASAAQTISVASGDTVTQTIKALDASKTYVFTIQATKGALSSNLATTTATTLTPALAAVSIVPKSITSSSVTLTWSVPKVGALTASKFEIYYSTSANGTFSKLSSASGSGPFVSQSDTKSASISGLNLNTGYFFKVVPVFEDDGRSFSRQLNGIPSISVRTLTK